jgi:Uma2 family endonuclease
MAQPAAHRDRFTWRDYRTWPDDERWELVDGQAFAMTPSPGFRHQHVCGAIYAELRAFLKGKPCQALVSPLDVKLSERDVVQPDVLVVCDLGKIRETHIEGAPDLVVEILSPSSTSHDRARKLALYARYGVREYWIVTPYPHLVEVLVLRGAGYRVHRVFTRSDTLTSPTLRGLRLDLTEVFGFPIPPQERIDEVRGSTPPYGRRRPGAGGSGAGPPRA